MPHHQLKKLVHDERESDQHERETESSPPSSSSSSSSLPCPLLDSHTPPTTSIDTNNNLFCSFNPNPHHPHLSQLLPFLSRRSRKLNDFSYSHVSRRTWDRLKKLCFAYLPSMDPLEFKNKYSSGLQKREELEREVTVLHKMLVHEQRVHEYLELLHNRQDGSALTIPSFLPPKMKEILAELAMVENEVTRLESQIKHLTNEMKHEKEANIERKYREWGRESLPPHPNTRRVNEKTAFESKALHFINKAIKGDYHLPNFSINEKSNASKVFHDEGGSREKLSKRSGLIKHPSPLREPRNPTPRRDRSLDITTEYQSKVLSTPLHTEEESIQKWGPNKLSENIMKCLIFIYVRLLRTSRAMEMEKSGSIARSTNFSLSFRAETNSNSKTSLTMKDSRQRDPYGIFDSEASIVRDIGPYKNLVRFVSNSMDMKCIQNSSSVPLFQKLKVLMDGLQKVDLRFLSHQHKLAFWINMYNACIMHGYLKYGVPSVLNQESLLGLMKKATLDIAGNTINALAIEHFILRNPQDSSIKEKNSRETIIGELYGVESPEPNIIFALCSGTHSSPAVKIYTAEGVAAELERSKLEYLQAAIVVSGAKKIALPELLLTNMNDFAADKESLMEWVCHQLPTAGSLRKSIVDCFRSVHGGKGSAVVEKIPYEFEFQYLLAI